MNLPNFGKIAKWFFCAWAAIMVLLQIANLAVNGASRETLVVVSELLIFAWFGIVFFLIKPL